MTQAECYQTDFKKELPEVLAYLDRNTALTILGISESYLRRDCSMLDSVSDSLPGWKHLTGARGFDRQTFYILWLFRKFCRQLGRGKGLEILIQELNK